MTFHHRTQHFHYIYENCILWKTHTYRKKFGAFYLGKYSIILQNLAIISICMIVSKTSNVMNKAYKFFLEPPTQLSQKEYPHSYAKQVFCLRYY